MVEHRPVQTFFCHLIIIMGILAICLPVWLVFVASTHGIEDILRVPMPFWPGSHFIDNYGVAFSSDIKSLSMSAVPLGTMMFNSLIMALVIAIGKICISIISAYAIVYFKFPFRMTIFWMILITLMLPVEVRIIPTYQVVAKLGLLNSYAGLTIPLIASATATFLFRQFFLTVPDELCEAAKIDGAGPLKFFRDILLPLSRTSIAALFVILFIYGWVQYLWPLLITTDESYYTILIGIKRMLVTVEEDPAWNIIMAYVIMAMVPPVLVVVIMQRQFVKGLIETEK